MKKLISAILILFLCVGIYSCSKNDSASTATTATTDNSSSPEVIIFPYSTDYQYPYNAHKAAYGCSGTNSSGYTLAPFFSTSTHDLKDRLPSSKWSYPVYRSRTQNFNILGKFMGWQHRYEPSFS